MLICRGLRFLSVQHAFDARDRNALSQHVSPTVFNAMLIDLNTPATGNVNIIQLTASLVHMDAANNRAATLLEGSIQEASDSFSPLAEIWHLHKNAAAPHGWVVDAIEQAPQD